MHKAHIIFVMGVFISLIGTPCLIGQAYLLKTGESRFIGSANGYLDQDKYGIGVTAGIAPGNFIDIKLALGKEFSRADDFTAKYISPQIKLHPFGIFWESALGLALLAQYSSEDYDFEDRQKFLFFDKSQKEKTISFGATVYYQFFVSQTINLIPEVGVIRNYSKTKTGKVLEGDSVDIFLPYGFVSKSDKDNYTSLFIGFNLRQKLSPRNQLVWQVNARLHEDDFSANLNVAIMI